MNIIQSLTEIIIRGKKSDNLWAKDRLDKIINGEQVKIVHDTKLPSDDDINKWFVKDFTDKDLPELPREFRL